VPSHSGSPILFGSRFTAGAAGFLLLIRCREDSSAGNPRHCCPTVCAGVRCHGFLSERKFSIHKVPLKTYMSKLWVYFLTTPSEGLLIQAATMWKTHTPTVLVDAAIVLSKRALPDEYRQLNPSSRSHVYPFSPMVSVASFSPHSSLAIPTYAPSSLGWSATHQVPSVSFHDSVFDNSGRACAAEVAISNTATLIRSKLCPRRVRSHTPGSHRHQLG